MKVGERHQKSLSPNRLMGFAAISIVFLNLTNLYTFVAGIAGISFQLTGAMMLFVLGGYTAMNFNVLLRLISIRPYLFFIILFFVIPLVSLVYAPYVNLRYVAYLLNFVFIFISASIWISKEGWQWFARLIFISWCVCVLGILLSYFVPDVFRSVALLQEGARGGGSIFRDVEIAEARDARAFGFYMQCNRAAFITVVHLMMILPTLFYSRPLLRILTLAISLFAILLTGSRGGFLIFGFYLCCVLLSELKNGVVLRGRITSGFVMVPRYAVLGVLALSLGVSAMMVSVESSKGVNAIGRIFDTLLGREVNILQDVSVQARFAGHSAYVERIIERPLWGRGFMSTEWGMYYGLIPLMSHNNFLEVAYQYGLLVAIASYGLLLNLCLSRQSSQLTRVFHYDVSWIIFIILSIWTFASPTLFDFRVFPVLMAFWFGMLYLPTSDARV